MVEKYHAHTLIYHLSNAGRWIAQCHGTARPNIPPRHIPARRTQLGTIDDQRFEINERGHDNVYIRDVHPYLSTYTSMLVYISSCIAYWGKGETTLTDMKISLL